MKKLIYIISTNKKIDQSNDYSDFCIKSWNYWCNKNNVDLVTDKDLKDIKNTYDKIGIVDTSTMIRWDAPNIFEMYDEDEFCGVVDTSDFRWILNNIKLYNEFFPDIKLNVDNYINSGVMLFSQKHLFLFEEIQNFYLKNKSENNKDSGKYQTLINYYLSKNNIKQKKLSPQWNLFSIHKKDMFKYNWQLNNDQTPYFIKYSYVWNFMGFDSNQKKNLMKQTWELTKHLYS